MSNGRLKLGPRVKFSDMGGTAGPRAKSAYPPTVLAAPAVKSWSRGSPWPPERNDDAPEWRRCVGIAPSSAVGCCQSMGRRRSSNFLELESFHLRKTVQRMAIPPTDAATTMSAVRMVLLPLSVEAAPDSADAAESVGCAAPVNAVLVTSGCTTVLVEGTGAWTILRLAEVTAAAVVDVEDVVV